MRRTRTDTAAVVKTGVPLTSAAHVVVDDEPVTVCWSTVPVACTDYLLGDITSLRPVHQPADKVPELWRSGNSTRSDWQARTEVQCPRCGQMIGPWALVRDGHLVGDELLDLAGEVAELAGDEYERQRAKLIAALTTDAEDTVRHLVEGTLTRDEVPDLEAMVMPGVGLRGDEVTAWAYMPHPDGGDDEVVEVSRPLPTTSTSS